MDQIEVTFSREVRYTISLDEAAMRGLRGKIREIQGGTLRKAAFTNLIEEGEFLYDYE